MKSIALAVMALPFVEMVSDWFWYRRISVPTGHERPKKLVSWGKRQNSEGEWSAFICIALPSWTYQRDYCESPCSAKAFGWFRRDLVWQGRNAYKRGWHLFWSRCD